MLPTEAWACHVTARLHDIVISVRATKSRRNGDWGRQPRSYEKSRLISPDIHGDGIGRNAIRRQHQIRDAESLEVRRQAYVDLIYAG